jgi:hypothetical protein
MRPGTTMYHQCSVCEIVGRRLAPPPPQGISDGVEGTLRGYPA